MLQGWPAGVPSQGLLLFLLSPDPGNHHDMDGGPGDRDPIQGGLMAGKEAVLWIPQASEAHVLTMKTVISKVPWIPLSKTVLIFLSPASSLSAEAHIFSLLHLCA